VLPFLIVLVVLIKVVKSLEMSALLPLWFFAAVVSCAVICTLVITLPGPRRRFPNTIIIVALAFTVITNGFVAFSKLITESRIRTEYRNTVMEIGKVAAPGYVVISGWTKGVLLEHYLSKKSCAPSYWIDAQDLSGSSGEPRQAQAFKKLHEAIAARRQIWLSRNHSAFFSILRRNGYEVTQFKMTKLKDVYVANAKD
jgi:hypothetical protein